MFLIELVVFSAAVDAAPHWVKSVNHSAIIGVSFLKCQSVEPKFSNGFLHSNK